MGTFGSMENLRVHFGQLGRSRLIFSALIFGFSSEAGKSSSNQIPSLLEAGIGPVIWTDGELQGT